MMVTPAQALSAVPHGLRSPLLEEYRQILENYAARKWLPTELMGGRFCEIVFTILDGHAKGSFASKPSKPKKGFVDACKALESNSHVPRSFQILIPRMLPALYEIRNNRGVGHTGGDVDPNHMDSVAVVGMVDWIMAELIRVFHNLQTAEAQELVDQIVERKTPLVWERGTVKRVLDTRMTTEEQVLVLLHSAGMRSSFKELREWTEYGNPTRFRSMLKTMHRRRKIEFSKDDSVELLPPGVASAEKVIATYS